jgi:(R,R)-butanediol dehydrogenase / meso-butanediol dehydrogenase / diacetyl reductase
VRVRNGDRVAIICHVTCGHCEHCLNDDLYFCDQLKGIGFDRNGGYVDYLLVPEPCCTPIPEDISFEAGSLMVDMLGTPFRAVKRSGLVPGNKIAIWGAGPIGLGLLMVAQRFGAQAAIVDLSDYRLGLARQFIPALAINPSRASLEETLKDWTNGCGVDVAFDCVGSEAVCLQVLSILRKRGKLVIVGVSHKLTLNPWEHFIGNEYTLIGTRNFNTCDFDQMVGLVRSGLPLLDMVTHRFPLERAQEAFSLFTQGVCGKILITG